MIDAVFAIAFFSVIDDIMNILTWTWWLWLFFLAWYFYKWSQDHLSFSPLLTISVGAILVYYLVFEHPIIGSISVIFWILLMSGVLWLLPMITALFNTLKPPGMPKGQPGQQM